MGGTEPPAAKRETERPAEDERLMEVVCDRENLWKAWVRRRLRCVQWKQWKRGKRRFAELRRLGVGKDLAAQTAGSPHGPWRISRSLALSIAMPDAFFVTLGLPPLSVR